MEDFPKRTKGLVDLLKLVAPGTPIREGINNVLRAETGGLIILGYNEEMKEITDGGFLINCPFSPAHLYELAKMDGALILNENGTKIVLANAQLIPDPKIPSVETGMRHRTAERVAKQTGHLAIAVSQRRNIITLYQGDLRYTLRTISDILTKANQAIQTLEKYKIAWNQGITNLGLLEFEDSVSLSDIVSVLHNVEMALRNKNELLNYINELGSEGRLIQVQLTELLSDLEEEAQLLIKDYHHDKDQNPRVVLKKLQELSNIELLEDSVILKLLGYSAQANMEEIVYPRGYRILNKIPRLPLLVIENLIEAFQHFSGVLDASLEELDEVDGIGEVRAKKIQHGLKRIHENLYVSRHH